jgi:NAD(P)-dependent dehydrogenase (short-subunit alcohol dehydrogenase family)
MTTSPDGSERPVALVTGASRGIGRATAIALGNAGCDVAVSARTLVDGTARLDDDPSVAVPGGLDTTVAAVEHGGGRGLAVAMDLLDRASLIRGVYEVLEHFGRIDVLVNNAVYQGPGTTKLFADLSEDDMRLVFEGNVHAQLALIGAVLPGMLERGNGTIVNMISATAYMDPPAKSGEGGWGMAYAMSKAAFARVAPLLHVEHGADGLRVFSVDPGFVITERMEASGHDQQYTGRFKGAGPDVIGKAIAWLVTDPASDELRGQVVHAQREVKHRNL